jgi:hypothetical protein
MLKRVYPHISSNRAELADLSINAFAITLKIGEVAHRDFTQDYALTNVDIPAQLAGFELRGRMNARFAILETKVFTLRHFKTF